MKAGKIYSKTMPYVWAKLLLSLATVFLSAILFWLLIALPISRGSFEILYIMFALWIALTAVLRFVIIHYIGYMFKAGHIAVITEAVLTGRVPEHQLSYGKMMVKSRFGAANAFFVVDKLISGAVKQIQKGIGKLGNALNFVPGMGAITNIAQMLIGIFLGYVDECCLGYTFYRKEQGAFKSAADGVVIYAQNWKTLLGSAAKTMAMLVFFFVAITLVLFLLISLVFRAFGWPEWAGIILAVLITLTIKYAFVDSFILTRTMVAYMGVAPKTVITFDLYGKLTRLSAKFKKLWDKGNHETPSPGYVGAQGYDMAPADKPLYCGACGAGNGHGARFCINCGSPLAAAYGSAGAY